MGVEKIEEEEARLKKKPSPDADEEKPPENRSHMYILGQGCEAEFIL
jgi:hypothetical protein